VNSGTQNGVRDDVFRGGEWMVGDTNFRGQTEAQRNGFETNTSDGHFGWSYSSKVKRVLIFLGIYVAN
jgi:hypothetical protein